MHRSAEPTETVVIDDDLIRDAFEEEVNAERKREASATQSGGGSNMATMGKLASMGIGEAGFVLSEAIREATALRLSFRNIFKVDNLQGFEGLTKLCLDNNVIEKVENLDHLVNLKWLDLSFNNLTKIEGLGNLTKLTDLTVFDNRITSIEGLDQCQNLNCLSIGNNQIKILDQIMYLRKFKKLKLVHFEGNPVCNDNEYRNYVLAHIKGLKYLDYALIQQGDIVAAREQYQDELLEIEERESIEEAARAKEKELAALSKQLKEANLNIVETLFKDMFDEDTEIGKLKLIPGVIDLIDGFQDNFNGVSEDFKKCGLEKVDIKNAEYAAYSQALFKMRTENEARAIKLSESYKKVEKKFLNSLATREIISESDVEPLKSDARKLNNNLMDLEVQQVEMFDDITNEFDTNFGELRNASVDSHQTYFRSVEELEDAFSEALTSLVTELLEKASNEVLPPDLSDEAVNLLHDRDTVLNHVVGSHDIHVGKLLTKEEEDKSREVKAYNDILKQERQLEYERNRHRTMEIQQLMDHSFQIISEYMSDKDADDDDGFDS
jgi:hypothetical protein